MSNEKEGILWGPVIMKTTQFCVLSEKNTVLSKIIKSPKIGKNRLVCYQSQEKKNFEHVKIEHLAKIEENYG